MTVRPIQDRSDVAGVIRVHGRAWRAAYDGFLPSAVLEQRTVDPSDEEVTEWRDRLWSNRRGVLVAVEDGAGVVGFADIRWGDTETKAFVGEGDAGLRAIYVDPDHWGNGVGTDLLEAGIDRLPDRIPRLVLEVFAENDRGRAFYEARGFEVTGRDRVTIADRSYPTVIYARGV